MPIWDIQVDILLQSCCANRLSSVDCAAEFNLPPILSRFGAMTLYMSLYITLFPYQLIELVAVRGQQILSEHVFLMPVI